MLWSILGSSIIIIHNELRLYGSISCPFFCANTFIVIRRAKIIKNVFFIRVNLCVNNIMSVGNIMAV